MRTPRFKRVSGGESVARPFHGWEYRIVGTRNDLTLLFNGRAIGVGDRRDLLRDVAKHHLEDHYRTT